MVAEPLRDVLFSRATWMVDMLLARPPPRELPEGGPPKAVKAALRRFEHREKATVAAAGASGSRYHQSSGPRMPLPDAPCGRSPPGACSEKQPDSFPAPLASFARMRLRAISPKPSADGVVFQAPWSAPLACAPPHAQRGPMPSADGRLCFSLRSSRTCLSAASSASGTSRRKDL